LLGDDEGLRRRHDPELLPVLVDDAYFPYPDTLVDANAVVTSGRAIESYNVLLMTFQWSG
jgi:hypothetical protein